MMKGKAKRNIFLMEKGNVPLRNIAFLTVAMII